MVKSNYCYLCLGDKALLEEVARTSAAEGEDNIAFASYFTLNNLNECLELLIKRNKLPEAAFFARYES